MSERSRQTGDPEIGTCHVCGRTFATQEELSQHLMDDHEDETLGSDRRGPKVSRSDHRGRHR
jgi:hypothetical protein